MVAQVDLRIAQKIQITRDGSTWYDSSIQDIRGSDIYIAIPYMKEHPLVLSRGVQVQVRFLMDDCSYLFETRVIGEVTSNIKMIRLDYPGEFKRVQQRMHVRLAVVLDVEYAAPEREQGAGGRACGGKGKHPVLPANKRNKKPSFTKSTAVDISGGGMKLVVRENIKEGSRLLLRFVLPLKSKPEQLQLEALVTRCIKADPDREVYNLGLRFENQTFHQEDIIVRYIYEKTAEQKRLM